MIQFGVSLMTEREILREGSLRKINTFGKNRRVICLTTDEQVNGIHHREDTVHIVVHIDATTGITVVGRQASSVLPNMVGWVPRKRRYRFWNSRFVGSRSRMPRRYPRGGRPASAEIARKMGYRRDKRGWHAPKSFGWGPSNTFTLGGHYGYTEMGVTKMMPHWWTPSMG